jgi:hypothetical protein
MNFEVKPKKPGCRTVDAGQNSWLRRQAEGGIGFCMLLRPWFQKSSSRRPLWMPHSAMMFSAPGWDGKMPGCLQRAPMTILQPASTTRERMKQPSLRKVSYRRYRTLRSKQPGSRPRHDRRTCAITWRAQSVSILAGRPRRW